MPKWKQFIQGNNLHEEHEKLKSGDPETAAINETKLSGKDIRKEYEEIINQPSTSTSSSNDSRKDNAKKSARLPKIPAKPIPIKPKPPNSTLFSLCEANNIDELAYYFEHYGDELVPDVNKIVDEYGWTLLMSAACAGANSVVEYLLEIGASLTKKEKSGLTAFDLAKRKNKQNTCELIQNWIAVRDEHLRNPEIEHADAQEPAEDTGPKFCAACDTEITSESLHNKCIAHLLSTSSGVSDRIHYGLPESNKGFQLMLKNGWNRNTGLGVHGQGQKFPVKTVLKRDREGFGVASSKQARVTHFGPFDASAVENPNRQKREKTITKEFLESLEKKARTKEANFRREFYSAD